MTAKDITILTELEDRFTEIRGMNNSLHEDGVLQVISKSTNTPINKVRERYKLSRCFDWMAFHYLEKGITTISRLSEIAKIPNLTMGQRQIILDVSLALFPKDSEFKSWIKEEEITSVNFANWYDHYIKEVEETDEVSYKIIIEYIERNPCF